MSDRFRFVFICLAGLLSASGALHADVVKPALIEISVYKSGLVEIEVRASIEALLTGIDARYKNTRDSPNAAAYDVLRALPGDELVARFDPFHERFLASIRLQFNGNDAQPDISKVAVPEPGYTKIPRISTILLTGRAPANATEVIWYYPRAFGDNAVRVRQIDQVNQQWHWSEWQWLRDDQASAPFSLQDLYARRPQWQTVLDYMVIGFEHILPLGLDHILFIVGLFLFSLHLRPLLLQVTMFTLAHTLTLGLAALEIISLSPRVVEPLIALSIAYVGIENIWFHRLGFHRLILVFVFGLVHGLGFAGVLADFGMPKDAFFTALISFNVGVEFGQLAVILIMYLLVGWWGRSHPILYQRAIAIPLSGLIAVTALIWTLQRLSM
ncbi:HupE/UreJ family protein [Gammaproteobacteria bacterium]|nr:HupE/UreJ family protein [Gammaproteobacteria bacterium]